MNPIYKFTLSANGGAEQQAFPVWRDDAAKEFELQSNEQFYRAKLSGKLTFVKDDYDFIVGQAFDAQFGIKIYISYDGGTTWALYWTGQFWKTDGEFDDDNKQVSLTPTVIDKYTDILAGLEKEFNLIDLAPEIIPIGMDKRPMIQVYVPGQTSIGCFLSGMWWEQECTPITNSGDLQNKYRFRLNKSFNVVEITQQIITPFSPVLPQVFAGESDGLIGFDISNGGFTFRYDAGTTEYQIIRESDNIILYRGFRSPLDGVIGTDAQGSEVYFDYNIVDVWARIVCDETTGTYNIPSDDPVADNRNYSRIAPYENPDAIGVSDKMASTPTEWGIYQPGQYYLPPEGTGWVPIARNAWRLASFWFNLTEAAIFDETPYRTPFILRNSYPLSSVISKLLGKIAPGITHSATTAYSQFLYGENLLEITQTIAITPKSNVINAQYDQPAQKAPITLKAVFDMLRECFRCYWYIDDQNRLRIEHITYFMNGGAYPGTPGYPVIGRDLTAEEETRNGKKWAFDTSKYQFDKPDMAARYQFGWMDDVTQLFEGNPIDIVSKYVNPDNIEQISVAQFTSDVDYILLNPNEISKDGFVLLGAIKSGDDYMLPYYQISLDNIDYNLQNGYVAFVFMQQYYEYDMPAKEYRMNGELRQAQGIKKLKAQTLKFPAYNDPNILELIKTNLGNGVIQKLSLNLSSRTANATLKYDIE